MPKKLIQDEFVERARQVHGGKYEYHKAEYKGSKIKLVVTCPLHGDWVLTPHEHISQERGCKQCGRLRAAQKCTLTTADFLSATKEIHGGLYDYTKSVYAKNKKKLTITCRVHGDFHQTPHGHLAGQGCKKCGLLKAAAKIRATTDEFVAKAHAIHDGRYAYDKVDYIHNEAKVTITCLVHGDFQQTPHDHLGGHGCCECVGLKRFTQDEWLQSAHKTHGDRYDYSGVVFINNKTKVIIGCKTHGVFSQLPDLHLNGSGCSKCAKQTLAELFRLSADEFVQRAKTVHGDKYLYDAVEYSSLSKKVSIRCPKHGPFIQLAGSHLQGAGCPNCVESKGEKRIAAILDGMGLRFKRQAKFKTCRHKKVLAFDFLVKTSDTKGILIEYQGGQHYKPVRWSASMTDEDMLAVFEDIKIRDKIKEEWAKKRGIPLLALPYWKKNKMPELIEEFIKEVA